MIRIFYRPITWRIAFGFVASIVTVQPAVTTASDVDTFAVSFAGPLVSGIACCLPDLLLKKAMQKSAEIKGEIKSNQPVPPC